MRQTISYGPAPGREHAQFSMVVDSITLLGWLLGLILITCALCESIEFIELLVWKRAGETLAGRQATDKPFVSFHVPTCSEPPEVVARTLLALHNLDYDAFEVLIVDNNTKDDELWKPIERLCLALGSRFRFFHLPQWPGFKAGALNFALQHTAPGASLIGVVDADYEIAPNYLREILCHLEDDQVAFVQTPQDYRDWSFSKFLRACNWEYWQVFAVSMVLRNRRNAILMHGTMSLVRREVIERSGGWAEWCLTEDSELGLRILAHGYQSVYVSKTYGRGLVPFTYRDYKRQRRRWVIGGVQQLRHHFRLFLPSAGSAPRLTIGQKLHYLQGWLPWFRCSVVVLSVPFALAAALAAILGLAEPPGPSWLNIGMMLVVAQLLLRQLVVYRHHLRLSWRDALGATIANFSLVWAVGCGWLSGWTATRQIFQRTPKRPPEAASWLEAARAELIIGTLALAFAVALGLTRGLADWQAVGGQLSYAILFLPAIWMARQSATACAPESSRKSERAAEPGAG
jgi:cellulose synthase/poly-beta-1,6-N-acetylglucosamine synthase-like glycosyltransferase